MSRWPEYERTRRKAVQGGIKTGNVHGSSWWGKRWMETLDSYNLGARLARGRTYARRGQVISIDVGAGKVTARVQGSRSTPYNVEIRVRTLSSDEWSSVREAVVGRPLILAKLFAGEMPAEIEAVFQDVGLSLFPESSSDLETDCSCPDWSNPCKHVAAVYILLGSEFDRDPFLIFKLRGLDRSELLSGMEAEAPRSNTAVIPEPLQGDVATYWSGADTENTQPATHGELRTPPVVAPLLKRLGGFPFWRGDELLYDALSPAYTAASKRGMEAFAGDRKLDEHSSSR